MALTLKEVSSSKDYKEFVYLPEKIHKGHTSWLPPVYIDEVKYFDPKKNRSFEGCDHIKLLAYKDGKPVGRIMGIISHKHNEIHNLKNVRFSFLECYNDPEVSHALISAIENWGREKGMNKIIGPFGFSDRDVQGLLIEGHEFEPVVDSACNFEFLPELVIREGYEKDADLVIYRYPLDLKLPDILYKIYDRVIAKKDFQFLEFTSRKPFKPLIVPVLRLVNETFSDLYGFVPMDEPEMKELAKRYMPILDPRFVKIVMKDGEVVAFLVSMPNLYRGIQKAKGRLFPFGIFHILYAMKHAKSTSLMLGAVKPAYRGKGLDVFFTLTTIESAKKAGMTSVDTHVVMEENDEMMGELKKYGAFLLKKFRVYGKSLD